MLATWFRFKYPQYMDGAIAGSSPILQVYGLSPASNAYSFSQIETKDASMEILSAVTEILESTETDSETGGNDESKWYKNVNKDSSESSETCQTNLQASWDVILELSESSKGREAIGNIFNLCSTPSDADTASEVLYVVEEAIAYMAMSSYAYSSNYITEAVLGSTTGGLPAYPVSYACAEYLSDDLTSDLSSYENKKSLLEAVSDFNLVFWNADGNDSCIDLDTIWDSFDDYLWDFLYCDSLLMPSGSLGNDEDMFWDDEWDADATISWCEEYYGISVDTIGGAAVKFGGYDLYKSLSNVVFSNGNMDPWYEGGVLPDMTNVLESSESLVSVLIEYNGHHADLMFSDESDSESLLAARSVEKEYITKWIEESYAKSSVGMCSYDANSLWEKLSAHPLVSAMNMVL